MSRRAFWIALATATLVRVAALPLPGTGDVRVWKVWSFAASKDVTSVYGVGGDPPVRGVLHFGREYTTVDYPPVALYELAAVGVVYRELVPGFFNDWRLTVAVKLPGFLAGLALTWLLYRFTRATVSEAAARWGATAFWLNPATLLNAEVLGYLDPLVMLPAVAAFLLLFRGRSVAAGAALAVALLTKPQAMLVVPAFALAAWHRGRAGTTSRAAAGITATLALALAPFVAVGAVPNLLLAFGSWAGRRDILSGYAANLWWVVTWLARAPNMVPEFGFPGAYLAPVQRILAISTFVEGGLPNPRPVATALVVVAVAWACWQARRARALENHLLLAAFTVHAFFCLAVSVHEHHMMLMVPLLVLAAALRPELRRLCCAVSAVCALNMNLFYGISSGWGWAVPRTLTPIDLSVMLAMANLGLLAWHARVLRTMSLAGHTGDSSAVTLGTRAPAEALPRG